MKDIDRLRSKLDKIDLEILGLLLKRLEIVRKIGSIKNMQNLPIVDSKREEEVYNNVITFASEHDLDSNQIKSIFHEIILLSKKVQNDSLNH